MIIHVMIMHDGGHYDMNMLWTRRIYIFKEDGSYSDPLVNPMTNIMFLGHILFIQLNIHVTYTDLSTLILILTLLNQNNTFLSVIGNFFSLSFLL